jgi:hypothetical protein
MNQKFDLQKMIDSLPPGLDQTILKVLRFHTGKSRAIGGAELVKYLAAVGYTIDKRSARAQISQLRKAGALICSAPGTEGGYWIAANSEEYNDFRNQEYLAKIKDMQETLAAMDKAAARIWGNVDQLKLL